MTEFRKGRGCGRFWLGVLEEAPFVAIQPHKRSTCIHDRENHDIDEASLASRKLSVFPVVTYTPLSSVNNPISWRLVVNP